MLDDDSSVVQVMVTEVDAGVEVMEINDEKIKALKDNYKTAYLAEHLERLLLEEKELIEASLGDPELKALAEDDLKSIRQQKEDLLVQIEEITKEEKQSTEFPKNIILEIRAGAGGEEAALFAEQLALMYQKYADKKKWEVRKVDESQSSLGGFREAIFELSGKDVYKDLRFRVILVISNRTACGLNDGSDCHIWIPILVTFHSFFNTSVSHVWKRHLAKDLKPTKIIF
jgi:protein subunit release factor A